MELIIKETSFPEVIEFNFDELKQELQNKMERYQGLIYTDEQVGDAKKELAALRKFVSALSDERIRIKKQCLQPYESFEAKIKELSAIVNEPISLIDRQVKEFEEREKEKKMQLIEEYWNGCTLPININLGQIFNEKWLNASVKMPAIQKEITAKLEQIEKDLAVIENLPSFAFEAKEAYMNTLDLGKAVSEANRLREMAERKAAWEAEQEQKKAETEEAAIKPSEPVDIPCTHQEPVREWVKFQAFMTVDEAKMLGQYMRNHRIQYKSI